MRRSQRESGPKRSYAARVAGMQGATMRGYPVQVAAKRTRASQLAALADKVYEASEPVHVPGELDYLDDHPQAGGPDTWTDAERNL